MIFLGLRDEEKREEIARYVAENDIRKTIVISADDFPLPIPDTDQVKFSDVIMYVTFYRLLQEIDSHTLVVINECLRSQNRYDLSYNCIRNYLNLTTHQLIFQQLPQIDTCEDFMILFDFDTRSRWKRRPFDPQLIRAEAKVFIRPLGVRFTRINIPTSPKTQQKYERERARLFAELGSKDPHTLPRNLYLIGGADKQAYVDAQSLPLFGASGFYVARNKRLNRDCIHTYAEVRPGQPYTILEFPHRFIDFTDFVQRTWQIENQVLVADLKVDHWYFNRYTEWSQRIHDTYASLSE